MKISLWNKVMKEVGLKQFAGPYQTPPFDTYIQSPISLVPKDNGKDSRLIFHLSYPRVKGSGAQRSVNANTLKHLCTMRYPDFMDAIQLCIQAGQLCSLAHSDMRSAFHQLGILCNHWRYLGMKAYSPFNGKFYYFVDKCLPFGSSISCSHFQRFSNAIAHLVQFRTKKPLINYLDDYLFIQPMQCAGRHFY